MKKYTITTTILAMLFIIGFSMPANAAVSSAPSNLIAITTATSAALSWKAPASDGGAIINDYIIQYKLQSSTTWLTFNDGYNNKLSTVVTGLSPINMYNFRVLAKNSFGLSSSSNTPLIKTGSGITTIPQNITSVSETNAIVLRWNLPKLTNGGVINDYIIQYKTAAATTWSVYNDLITAERTARIEGLTDNAKYQFKISAKTAQGLGTASLLMSATTLTGLPAAPTGIKAEYVNTTTKISWVMPSQANGGTIYDYVLQYKKINDVDWTVLTEEVGNETFFDTDALDINKIYMFRVAGITSFGIGEYSSVYYLINPTTSTPQNLKLTLITKNSAKISWVDPAGKHPNWLGYTILLNDVPVGSTTGNSFNISGLNVSTVYSVKVASYVDLYTNPILSSSQITLETKPNPPLRIYGTATTSVTSNTLSISVPYAGKITKTIIKLNGNCLGSQYASSSKTFTTGDLMNVTVTGLTPGANCSGSIYVYNESGSSYDAFNITTLYAAPSAVTGIAVYKSGGAGYSIRWNDINNQNVTMYYAYLEDGTLIGSGNGGSPGIDTSTFTSGQQYTIYLVAYNGTDGVASQYTFVAP